MIILVSAFANLNNNNNNRVKSIFSQIKGEKILITTDFNHTKKRYYDFNEMNHPNQVNLHVPSYTKNISLRRIWSHIVFAFSLMRYLNNREENPDMIYCTMPTSTSAYACARFCQKRKIKFIIDVIDLWPDSLIPLVKGKKMIKLFLFPWTYITRFSYKSANTILGESIKYADEAKRFNPKANVLPIYLGIDVNFTNEIKRQKTLLLNKTEGEVWIVYAGNLGNSYDFNTLLNAMTSIHGKFKYKLWFLGDGNRRKEIESYISTYGLNAEITGFLSYNILLEYLSYCDIAINIFRQDTEVIYSYKFNDYVAMNCFVLNSLEGETANMVDYYKIGRNFNFTDNHLSTVLFDTLSNWSYYSSWKSNTNNLIDEKLDKEKIYSCVSRIFTNN